MDFWIMICSCIFSEFSLVVWGDSVKDMRGLEVYLLRISRVRCNIIIVKFSQAGCKGPNEDFLIF